MADPTLQPLLDRFEAAALADPSILGVLYTGSLGRGTADRFSDLDLEVWLAADACTNLSAVTRDLLAVLGPVGWSMEVAPGWTHAMVAPDWRRVDLHLRAWGDTEPAHGFVGAQIVKDVEGTLARLIAASTSEDVVPSWEEARAAIMGAIGDQIYIADNNARGAIWEAAGGVSHHTAVLYELLARLRGRRSYGFRYAEALLSLDEQQFMWAAWPAVPDAAEVRRSARALWGWTLHVWAEAERNLGRPLEVTIDESGLLAAVDARYEAPTSASR
jgi:hypothetical protein